MLKFWATCADIDSNVFFNEIIEAGTIQQATETAKSKIPAEDHDGLCVTWDNEANYGGPVCVNIDTHWNKKLQCFPVRITMGSHNLQYMTSSQMDEVTIEIRTDFQNKGKAKAFAEAIGAMSSCGAYL
jgi:hypothetical protein